MSAESDNAAWSVGPWSAFTIEADWSEADERAWWTAVPNCPLTFNWKRAHRFMFGHHLPKRLRKK